MSAPTTTIFVSCFVKIYETQQRADNWRIKHFETLLNTGIQIHLFISPEYDAIFDKMRRRHPNLKCTAIDIHTTLPLFAAQHQEMHLPAERNCAKDTYQYMALMNSKLEFIHMAASMDTAATHFAWIDFNIPYIFKEPEYTLSFLNFISTADFGQTKFLYIPGCWHMPPSHTPLIIESINWHFCGGFFLGDHQSVLEFHRAVCDHLCPQTVHQSRMVWETNFWAFLHCNHIWKPTHWVAVGDHDDTMITKMPTELYIRPLMWRTVAPPSPSPPSIANYNLSSISYTKRDGYGDGDGDGDEFGVCRFINYRLSEDGRQYIYENGDTPVIKNRNILINYTINEMREIEHTTFNEFTEAFSVGLEDIRIYPDMSFSASSVSLANGNVPQMVYGVIDPQKGCVTSMQHIASPFGDSVCEKNWIFIGGGRGATDMVIYRWSPFQIATFETAVEAQPATINVVLTLNLTPQYLFRNMRGSTIFCPYRIYEANCKYNGDWLVGVTHYSIDQADSADVVRKYYHCLVLLNPRTLIPFAITHPFTFNEPHSIEFCIGMRYENDVFTFWVSIMDRSPMVYTIHKDRVVFDILIGNSYV